jgi:alkanesulfonate monooxygenase SsuD/methylene tetrahydromethanopterin reductase-like flavin-dependent oxidoreductase (luciferase family)
VRTDLLLDPFDATWTDVLEASTAAEQSGFDGIWTWDHLAGGVHRARRVLECWTVLTAVAASVPRLAIGPLVLNVANRPPGTVAVMAATLQEVSGGRLLLGLGAGGGVETPYAAEQQALDRKVPQDVVRRQQVEEAVGVMREVWSGRRGGVGGFMQPDPVPPVVIGAFGPRMAELAGRVGDGINTQAHHPELAALVSTAREAHAAAGRSEEPFMVTVFAGFSERWILPDGAERRPLVEAGVDRLILLAGPPYPIDRIRAAGRVLGPAGVTEQP